MIIVIITTTIIITIIIVTVRCCCSGGRQDRLEHVLGPQAGRAEHEGRDTDIIIIMVVIIITTTTTIITITTLSMYGNAVQVDKINWSTCRNPKLYGQNTKGEIQTLIIIMIVIITTTTTTIIIIIIIITLSSHGVVVQEVDKINWST